MGNYGCIDKNVFVGEDEFVGKDVLVRKYEFVYNDGFV